MKFMSKILNLRVVLKSSIPAVTLAGGQLMSSAQAGIYAKFEDGLLSVEDEHTIELLKAHKDYPREFWSIDSEEHKDYYRPGGSGGEPEHDITNIEYGHVGKNMAPRSQVKLTPEMQKILSEIAAKMATEMFQKMVSDSNKDKVPGETTVKKALKEQDITFTSPKSDLIQPPAPVEDETNIDLGDSETEPGVELKPRAGRPAKAK